MTDQCSARTISGTQCNKPAGHNGQHQIIRPTWTYEWTDETEATNADNHNRNRY